MSDRISEVIRALILAELAPMVYLGVWEYEVTSVRDDGSIDGIPTDPSFPLPELNAVPYAALVAGGVSKPAVGSRFLVDFLRSNGTNYVVFNVAPLVDVATIDASETIEVGTSASNPVPVGPVASTDVARVGDSITVFWAIGLLNGTVNGATPVTNLPCQILTPAPGVVTYGQDRVRA